MMGIKEDSDMSQKAKKCSEGKKYIVVKNHVREVPNVREQNPTENFNEINVNKEAQESKMNNIQIANSSDSDISASGISEKDIKELRTVYDKCKAVLKKMEIKYGHLLQLDGDESSKNRKRRLSSTECQCSFKKKIVYDDDGRQIYKNVNADHHICLKNIEKPSNPHTTTETLNIDIEDMTAYELPDDIDELTKITKEPKLSKYMRYQVTQKIKNIRYDNMNSLRFEKPTLIDKLKTNCKEIFDFNGSNLSSLPGYPTSKIQ